MVDCTALRERLPDLLTETIDRKGREETHRHIETCESCQLEWAGYRDTWRLMGELPEVPVPSRARARFVAEVQRLSPVAPVLAFPRRPVTRWLSQAAALVVLVGGSFFLGQRTTAPDYQTPASIEGIASLPFSIAESRVLPASDISPEIEGRPQIQNVRFLEPRSGSGEVGIAFDITSHVTVTGKPEDKSLVSLLSYVLQNQDNNPNLSKSDTIQWVRETYGSRGVADPAIVKALANVLKNDTHEGVRIKAVETLNDIPPASAPEARLALIEALRNDPNPAVRIKAIEALANLARSGDTWDPATVDMLREKASQQDENLYVRVKAAEALSQINL
ncbi:MAG TPA: HEAT repeat domain-containing protein [Thermoanaerobaculia bacterium]|nr:HEAT repeat domain-containing protein [Thermoanaerobaculia bacterium]